MPTIHVFPLFLMTLWIVALVLFVWMHLPEPTITEIIRALESRS
jgi:type IV secretory pathway TrbD component